MQVGRCDRSAGVVWRRSRVNALLLAATSATLLSSSAFADAPEWGDVSSVETVTVMTETEEGELRETTIWLVMVDGNAYIRTSRSTGWGKDVVRNPAIVLRVEGADYPVSATFIDDPAEIDRAVARFREKYGFEDAFIGIFRGSNPLIMRLDSLPESAT